MSGDSKTLKELLWKERDRFRGERDEMRALAVRLVAALADVQVHLDELRSAWERGCISEHDGHGGERSNRNVANAVNVRAALSAARAADLLGGR